MTFEPYDGPTSVRHDDQPALTVRASCDGYLNAAADRARFSDVDEVVFLTDTETNQLAIAPATAYPDHHAYGLLRDNQHGGEVFVTSVLREFGIEAGGNDEAVQLTLEWHDDITAYVTDVDPLLDDPEPATDDGGISCTVADCDRAFDTERGMKIHRGRSHDEDSSTPDDADDQEEEEEALLTRQARSFVEDQGIRTLSGLADSLDVSEGVARKHARRADVYSSLKDDAIERPGVSS